jgi:hypothetical protein
MPLFYFDYDDGDGEGPVHDQVGTELPDIEDALLEASHTMAELAADALPGSRSRIMGIVVRDELGATRLRVSLKYRVESIA